MSSPLPLNIIFAGTPEFAARHLQPLLSSHHRVVSVYTQPDRPAGRGKKLQASPVKELALSAGIEVQQPATLKDSEAQEHLASYHADIMVVVAYGLLLPKVVLEIPHLGCVNVHASLLPRWRGAAPIQRAIEAGDDSTGVTIMQMDVGLDTGDMLTISECPILPNDSAADLHDRLVQLGPDALLRALAELAENRARPQAQDDQLATYAHKLTKEEAAIRWQDDASTIARRVRAFNPFPVAHTLLEGERLRVYKANVTTETHDVTPGTILHNQKRLLVACGNGTSLALETLQLPGKKALPVAAVLNGMADKLCPGTALGQS